MFQHSLDRKPAVHINDDEMLLQESNSVALGGKNELVIVASPTTAPAIDTIRSIFGFWLSRVVI